MKRLCPSSSRVRNRARRARRQRIVPLLWLAALLAGPAQAHQRRPATAAWTPTRCSASRRWANRPAPAWHQARVRVEIEPGRLDPRLRLAPCERIEPYLPPRRARLGPQPRRPALRAGAERLERLSAGDRQGVRAGLGRRRHRCRPAPCWTPASCSRPRSTGRRRPRRR